jgi:hypothetical protein
MALQGLFPYAYVEIRPYGVELDGVLQPSDWKQLEHELITLKLSKGQHVLREGDPISSGECE